MNKENLLFAIIGLLAGLIIGFVATNNLNRNSTPAQSALPNTTGAPANPQGAPGGQNAAMPGVAEAIEKADAEPQNFDLQIKAGEMFARINNFERALPYFERANKIKPDDYRLIVILGNTNFDLNKFEAAQTWYETALKKDDKDVNVRTDLGLTYFLRTPKDIERAIKEYKAALAIKPDFELALQNLAVAYREKNDAAGLTETLAALEKVNPSNPVIQRLKQ
jgi:tetratricopeptide (TPR) repeat protein